MPRELIAVKNKNLRGGSIIKLVSSGVLLRTSLYMCKI
jgi:hypothetical protein